MKLKINKNKPKMIGVRLSEEDYKTIQEMAEKEKVPQTEIIRAIVSAGLKEINKNEKN
mgnify:FL=1